MKKIIRLKKLICTSYAGSRIDQIQENVQLTLDLYDGNGNHVDLTQGYVLTVSKMPGKTGEEVSDDVIQSVLKKKNRV